jgi:hypothetical protein
MGVRSSKIGSITWCVTPKKGTHTPCNFSKFSADLAEYTKWAQSNAQTTDAALAAEKQTVTAGRWLARLVIPANIHRECWLTHPLREPRHPNVFRK